MEAKAVLQVAVYLLAFSCSSQNFAVGLSWPVCADGGSVWVTERPQTGPLYPGANLWFVCDSALNILGDSVDPCVNKGALCSGAVSNAICRFLGYDVAYEGSTAVPAAPGEVVRSLTGEYCLRKGVYSTTLPDNLASMPGEPCLRINRLICIRTIESMAMELEDILEELAYSNQTQVAMDTGLAVADVPGVNAAIPAPTAEELAGEESVGEAPATE